MARPREKFGQGVLTSRRFSLSLIPVLMLTSFTAASWPGADDSILTPDEDANEEARKARFASAGSTAYTRYREASSIVPI